MENRFDALAKSVFRAISRREVFWRLGSGLGGSLVASLGVSEDGQPNCLEHCCVIHCVSQLRGQDREVCIQQCQQGEGLLAAVCADLCTNQDANA